MREQRRLSRADVTETRYGSTTSAEIEMRTQLWFVIFFYLKFSLILNLWALRKIKLKLNLVIRIWYWYNKRSLIEYGNGWNDSVQIKLQIIRGDRHYSSFHSFHNTCEFFRMNLWVICKRRMKRRRKRYSQLLQITPFFFFINICLLHYQAFWICVFYLQYNALLVNWFSLRPHSIFSANYSFFLLSIIHIVTNKMLTIISISVLKIKLLFLLYSSLSQLFTNFNLRISSKTFKVYTLTPPSTTIYHFILICYITHLFFILLFSAISLLLLSPHFSDTTHHYVISLQSYETKKKKLFTIFYSFFCLLKNIFR